MLKSLFTAATLAGVALTLNPAPALAQSAGDWSFALGAETDNRSKDVSKSAGDPSAWALAEWTSADGMFYAGPGIETIKSSTGSELELEAGVGVRPEFAGFDLDLNATHKWQLAANPGADDDAWELTASASRSIGPAKARLLLQHSPDGTGSTEAWTWIEGRLGWDFTPKLSGTAAVGRREQDNAVDYTGWNAGLTYAFTPKLELDVRWYDTNAHAAGDQYDSALVAGVSVFF